MIQNGRTDRLFFIGEISVHMSLDIRSYPIPVHKSITAESLEHAEEEISQRPQRALW